MSHEIETMAYAHEVPWHGLGVNVDPTITPAQMLVAAGLDWQVERVPVCCADDPTEIPDRFAIRRATDRKVYSIVSDRWKPVQNIEILSFFQEWATAGHAELETAGSLRGGAQVWALARLKRDFMLPGGDAVRGFVLMLGSHEAGRSTVMQTTAIRVVCANTLRMALSGRKQLEVRWTHSSDFKPEMALRQMEVSREEIGEFEKNAQLLMKLNISREDAIRILAPVYQPQAEVRDLITGSQALAPSMAAVLWAEERAAGATPGTGWGLLNGVTYYSDHMIMGETDNRFLSAQTGLAAKRKSDVFSKLLEMAQ